MRNNSFVVLVLAVAVFVVAYIPVVRARAEGSQQYVAVNRTIKFPQEQAGSRQARLPPLELSQIVELIPLLPDSALTGEISDRGINFKVDTALINQLKRRGAGVKTVAILTTLSANRAPSVTLTTANQSVQPGDVIQVRAVANDLDGDSLEYVWSTDSGSIKGEGPVVDFQAPHTNQTRVQVNISVLVFDRKGGSNSAQLQVVVSRRDVRETGAEAHLEPHDRGAASNGQLTNSPVVVKSALPPVMDVNVKSDGEFSLITLVGASGDKDTKSGSLNVTLDLKRPASPGNTINGVLTGRPCAIELAPIANIADYALVERPALENKWARVVARVRPASRNVPIHFRINWIVVEARPYGNEPKVIADSDDSEIEKARLINKSPPQYPAAAMASRITGSVFVSVEVDEEGNVQSAKAVSGPEVFRDSAEKAAMRCKFRPRREKDRPIRSTEIIRFDFSLL